jgi:membrane protein DedA with SNARE-associated domain
MPPELAYYIVEYGYLIIFGLVFFQELGVPNPIPNELVLLFAGYLASIGTLDFVWLIVTVVAADFIGTAILYSVFYYYGKRILKKFHRWLPSKKIQKLENYLTKKGRWGIYVGRLLPLLRGYASVAAGLLRLPPREFIPAVIFSALTWSGGYVFLGWILGPKWETVTGYFGVRNSLLLIVIVFIVYIAIVNIYDKIKKNSKL